MCCVFGVAGFKIINQRVMLKSQYEDGNMGVEAEQQLLLKNDKVQAPWPMSH